MKGLYFLEFNDHFRGKQIVVCAPGQDGCYLIFVSRSVLILIAPYGTHENHSAIQRLRSFAKNMFNKETKDECQ